MSLDQPMVALIECTHDGVLRFNFVDSWSLLIAPFDHKVASYMLDPLALHH